ncbi:GNAT family N-acetyltransferase [Phaeobacter sp. 11ANDIMAR09]|uniref:GNAT family N-acetyltransferase n=1 Tax=Phaeobacter sp. 11ANDIMAR09 TaxID=1225647 RepID=UPI0006C85AC1|nr:GNAT family N-acetyltransferase [Phaeobacter sp. 11ANDIMAR09]
MPLEIRHAQPRDSASIAEIANAMIRDTLFTFTSQERQPQEIAARLEQDLTPFLVAERGGRILGFATYSAFRSGPGYRHTQEHSIQLRPEAQGHGLGRALMGQLEKEARTREVHVLVAGISSANPKALKFHRAIGYTQTGFLPQVGRKFNQWLDLILMQKQL